MKRADEAKGVSAKVGRTIGDKCSDSMLDLHLAQGGQVADPCSQRGPTDIELGAKSRSGGI
jgi:hypothetical protein